MKYSSYEYSCSNNVKYKYDINAPATGSDIFGPLANTSLTSLNYLAPFNAEKSACKHPITKFEMLNYEACKKYIKEINNVLKEEDANRIHEYVMINIDKMLVKLRSERIEIMNSVHGQFTLSSYSSTFEENMVKISIIQNNIEVLLKLKKDLEGERA